MRSVLCASLVSLLWAAPAAAWTVAEDFDGQTVDADCAPFWETPADSRVTADNSNSGSQSCRFRITRGGTGWGGGFSYPTQLARYDEYWIRFRLFIPEGFDYGAYGAGDRLKFIRNTTSNMSARLDWYWNREGTGSPYAVILERDDCAMNCWQSFGSASTAPVRGTWETWEMYVKLDTVSVDEGGQARSRAWKNGVLIGDLTNRPTISNAGDIMRSSLIFSYWNAGSPATQFIYFDDLVATNEPPASMDAFGNPYIGDVGSATRPDAGTPAVDAGGGDAGAERDAGVEIDASSSAVVPDSGPDRVPVSMGGCSVAGNESAAGLFWLLAALVAIWRRSFVRAP